MSARLRLMAQIACIFGVIWGIAAGPGWLGWLSFAALIMLILYDLFTSELIRSMFRLLDFALERPKFTKEELLKVERRKHGDTGKAPRRSRARRWLTHLLRPAPARSKKKQQAPKQVKPRVPLSARLRGLRQWAMRQLVRLRSALSRLLSLRRQALEVEPPPGNGTTGLLEELIAALRTSDDPEVDRILDSIGPKDRLPRKEELALRAVKSLLERKPVEVAPSDKEQEQSERHRLQLEVAKAQLLLKECRKALFALAEVAPGIVSTEGLDDSGEIDALGTRILDALKQLQAPLAALIAGNAELQEANSRLTTQLEEAVAAEERLQGEVLSGQQTLETLRQQLEAAVAESEQLSSSAAALTEQLDKASAVAAEQRSKAVRLQTELEQAERRNLETREALGWAMLELAAWPGEVDSALAQLAAEYKAELDDLKAVHTEQLEAAARKAVEAGYRTKSARLAGVPVALHVVQTGDGVVLQVFQVADPQRYPDALSNLIKLRSDIEKHGWRALPKQTEWSDWLSEAPVEDRQDERRRRRVAANTDTQ